LQEAVIERVRVEDQRRGTECLRLTRLDAAERAAVPGDDHLADNADPERIEQGIIGGQAVVDVHDGCRHVAGSGVAVHRRPGLLLGGWVSRQNRFGKVEADAGGADHLDYGRVVIGEVDIKWHPESIESP
jgi:hypothetical protein